MLLNSHEQAANEKVLAWNGCSYRRLLLYVVYAHPQTPKMNADSSCDIHMCHLRTRTDGKVVVDFQETFGNKYPKASFTQDSFQE